MDIYDQIPGYKDAVLAENQQRAAAFIPGIPEVVAGIMVSPLTYEMELRLRAVRSPFFVGGLPNANDIAVFLWAVSEEYQRAIRMRWIVEHASPWLAGLLFDHSRRSFVKRLRRLDYLYALNAIRSYIKDAYADAPSGSSELPITYYSEAAGLFVLLSDKCNMSMGDVMGLPIKVVWQLLRAIERRENPAAIQFNPSDRIRGEWLDQRNSSKN